jgi:hypothetical protein
MCERAVYAPTYATRHFAYVGAYVGIAHIPLPSRERVPVGDRTHPAAGTRAAAGRQSGLTGTQMFTMHLCSGCCAGSFRYCS